MLHGYFNNIRHTLAQNETQMATFAIILWHAKNTSDNTHSLKIRITKNRKSRYINLGIRIRKEDWNSKKRQVRSTHPDADRLNDLILTKLRSVQSIGYSTEMKNPHQSLEHLRQSIETPVNKQSFFDFAVLLTKRLEDNQQVASMIRNKTLIKKMKTFTKGADVSFDAINVEWLHSYKAYLVSRGNKPNTIHNALKWIRSVLYAAIRAGHFPQDKNPFFQFKLKAAKTHRIRLSVTEMQQFAAVILKKHSPLWKIQQYFLFSYYVCGMRIGDLIRLKMGNIQGARLVYTMHKTKNPRSILLVSQTQEILNHFYTPEAKKTDFLFPILDPKYRYDDPLFLMRKIASRAVRINNGLKEIAVLAGIEKQIHFHTARHSWANNARLSGLSLYDISKGLGHTSVTTTERYLDSMDESSVDAALTQMFG